MNKILVFGVTENPGGVESFLMNYYRWMDRKQLQFDFLCNTSEVAYESEIRKLGGVIYRIPARRDGIARFQRALDSFFGQHAKEYKAIWVNVCSLANVDYLKYAKKYGIECRIIHCHNGANADSRLRGLVHRMNRLRIKHLATEFWSCSRSAAPWFFGTSIRKAGRVQIIPNAIPCSDYQYHTEWRESYRQQFGLGDQLVIGHIGRFHFQKNHELILKIFEQVHRKRPDSVLVLIGQGERMEEIRQLAASMGLGECVWFLGVRNDIPQLYSMMDAFLMPSVFEGLPVVGIEAQAAGLPCLFSEAVTEEVCILPKTKRMSLEAAPEEWADQLLQMAGRTELTEEVDRNEQRGAVCMEAVRAAGFDIETEAKKLQTRLENLPEKKKYVIAEHGLLENHAGAKARRDVADVLIQEGFEPVFVTKGQGKGILHKLFMCLVVPWDWFRVCRHCVRGSELLIQFPLAIYPKVGKLAIPWIRFLHRHHDIIFLIHDLDSIREPEERTTEKENERMFLTQASAVICHNQQMHTYIREKRLTAAPIVELGLFDYLPGESSTLQNAQQESTMPIESGAASDTAECGEHRKLVIAGNLDSKKAGYLYQLYQLATLRFELYGPNYQEQTRQENVQYRGQCSPEQLLTSLHGSFGLVWDGEQIASCTGLFGRYLRFNNPHKASLYLAAGLPVIVWKQSALAEFVKKNHVGLCVDSLEQLPRVLEHLTEEEYQACKKAAERISRRVRNGSFTKQAVRRAEDRMKRER